MAHIDYGALTDSLAERRANGDLVGLGLGFFVEKSGLGPFAGSRIEVDPAGCAAQGFGRTLSEDAPSPLNPLGVKGTGEGGTNAGGAVIAAAIDDALGRPGAARSLPVTPNAYTPSAGPAQRRPERTSVM